MAAPDRWLLCDGSIIPPEDKYKDLKTLLGKPTTPDLRGRTLIGAEQGTGLAMRVLGQQGGEENHTLIINEMPKHHHGGWGEIDGNWPFGVEGTDHNKIESGRTDNKKPLLQYD
jgi:microcystin-dependent protein